MAEIDKISGMDGMGIGAQALSEARFRKAEAARAVEVQVPSDVRVRTSGGKKAPDLAEVEKSATQFEALLLQQMFKSMWESVPKEGMLSGSREEELFRDMLNENLAKEVSEKQSIGIKKVVVNEMKRRLGLDESAR